MDLMPYNPAFEQRVSEAASVLLRKSNGRMNYMKLIKLLYLAERKTFETKGRPLTYDNLSSLPRGPVLSTTLDLIKNNSKSNGTWKHYYEINGKSIKVKNEFPKYKKLSPADVRIIEEVFTEYGHLGQYELAKITEELPEWKNPGQSSSPIELRDLLQVMNFSVEEINDIIFDINDKSSLDALFC
jgi:uncharacterized phage-associated protein